MKTSFFLIPLLLGIFLLAGCKSEQKKDPWAPSGDSENDSDTTDDRFDPVVDAFITEMENFGAPGAALAIIEEGEVTFARGFGTKLPLGGDPVEATTIFRIASMSKMLTATALLQQVDEGEVDLSAPVTNYIPYFSFDADETWAPSITGQHLLSHSTGMADYLEIDVDEEFKGDDALSEFTANDFTSAMYLMAPAGAMYNYSNPNFDIAGLVVEEVTGTYYATYMDQEIFTPLGMDRTFFLPSEVLGDEDFACGFTTIWADYFTNPIAPDSYDNGWARPAGYAFSNVLDLAKWVNFLRAGDPSVLSESSRQAMQEKQMNMKVLLDYLAYGYGLVVSDFVFVGDDFYEMRVIEHNGALPGFSSEFHYVPSLDFGFITLASCDGGYFYNAFETALATLTELPEPSTLPDLTMDPDEYYDAYVGNYLDPNSIGMMEITRDEDNLRINMPDMNLSGYYYSPVLVPISPDNFIMTLLDNNYQMTFIFENESDSQAKYLRHRAFVGTRVSDEEPLSQPLPSPMRIQKIDERVQRLQKMPMQPPSRVEQWLMQRASN